MLGELPEVEMPRKTSPGWPRASIWRAKIWSKPKSLRAGGEDGGVGGEGDGAEGGAVCGEADDELGDEVLGVGGGASVAGDEEFVAGIHGLGGELGDGDDGVGDGFLGEDGLHGGDGLSELLLDYVLHGFSGGLGC